MRTQKKVGTKVTDYYYDSNNNLIVEKTDSATLFFYYDTENSPVALSYNGKMFYYVKNLLGDIVKILDKDGISYASYVYDSWGNILEEKGEPILRRLNPLRYRGYVYDEDTTLYYLQTRYYDPTTGRFINADDTAYIGATGTVLSANIFTYCENNPVNNVDYTGQWLTSYHKYITEEEGFKGSKYKTVRNWAYNADVYPCESTSEYSAPFHARGKEVNVATPQIDGLDIATKLYNLALKIKKTKQSLKFTIGKSKKGYYSVNYLKYGPKKGKIKETLKAQNDFLKIINIKDWNKQSQMLLGLALHTYQDYFAHVVRVTIRKCKNNYYLYDGFKHLETRSCKICRVDDSDMMDLNNNIEDYPAIFPWRVNTAKAITYSIFRAWKKNKSVKCLYRISNSGLDLSYYRRTTGLFSSKIYWTIESFKYYVKIKY